MAMDEFVPPGSEVHLYNDVPVGDREVLLLNGGLNVDSLQVRLLRIIYAQCEVTCELRLQPGAVAASGRCCPPCSVNDGKLHGSRRG